MEQLTCDFAVVAAGPGGLAAACAAAEKGLDVIVLEKTGKVGGAGAMGMGILAVGSHIQEEQGTPVDPDEAFMSFMDYTHWLADARLVREYFNKSADTILWLEHMGVRFAAAGDSMVKPSYHTWHVVKPEEGLTGPGCAAVMFKKMRAHAEALGARVFTKTPAQRLIMENGRVAGVTARREDGEELAIRAKAVLVATGGCGNNKDMLHELTGYTYGVDYYGHLVPGAEGDGLRMAWEAGCGKTPVELELTKKTPVPLNSLVNQACQLCSLLVDTTGRRFMNEDTASNSPYIGNALKRLPGRVAWLLFDGAQAKAVEERMKNRPQGLFSFQITATDMDAEIRELEKKMPHIVSGDSLAELAAKTGIDGANLAETVARYNRYCAAGRDEEFAKSKENLQPIATPRFYAAKVYGGGYGTLGGIRANENMEVLDPEGRIMPGFYAAGNEICTIYAGTYSMHMPGNSMGFAINSGRIAGENAAAFVKSLS